MVSNGRLKKGTIGSLLSQSGFRTRYWPKPAPTSATDGFLYLLSDKSSTIARLDNLPAGGGTAQLLDAWQLGDLDGKPEGLTFTGDHRTRHAQAATKPRPARARRCADAAINGRTLARTGNTTSGISSGDDVILPERHPACRRREPQPGTRMERANLRLDVKGKATSGENREAKVPMQSTGADRSVLTPQLLSTALQTGLAILRSLYAPCDCT
jgi:hypothetical protein